MRVRIELLDVTRHDTENCTKKDKLYIVSSFNVGCEIIQVGLTTPLMIGTHETKRFDEHERLLFVAEVPDDQYVQGGMVAFDADFTENWKKRSSWIGAIQDHVMTTVQTTVSIPRGPLRSAVVLASAVHGWYLVAPKIDEEDERGQLTLDYIPALGPECQQMPWEFQWTRALWSDWAYTIRYRISRS